MSTESLREFLYGETPTFKLDINKNPDAISNLKKLETLGILSEHLVAECIAQVTIDPYGFIATLLQAKEDIGIHNDGYVIGSNVVFQVGPPKKWDERLLEVGIFDNNVAVHWQGGEKPKSCYATMQGSELYKNLLEKKIGKDRLEHFVEMILLLID